MGTARVLDKWLSGEILFLYTRRYTERRKDPMKSLKFFYMLLRAVAANRPPWLEGEFYRALTNAINLGVEARSCVL